MLGSVRLGGRSGGVHAIWKWCFGLLLAVVAVTGWLRVQFETDVLAVLPSDLPEVRGLQTFQEVYGRDRELVVLVESDHDEGVAEYLAPLAQRLESAGLSERVRWQSSWQDDPEGLAELVAWLWLHAEPEVLDARVAQLSAGQLSVTLEESLREVATALGGTDMAMAAHDPLGLADLPALRRQLDEGAGNGYTSADGQAGFLLVEAPEAASGYAGYAEWIGKIEAEIGPWAAERALRISFTGDPAFEAEIGQAMERDMSGTVAATSLLVAGLFMWMQRRWRLLVGLVGAFAAVFGITLGVAGWAMGQLSMMTAGFAAILVGLVVDYGVLICQEARVVGADRAAVRASTGRSIIAAAVTTALVFFALNLSLLPGIAQLGSMVGLGILIGAAVMLVWYLPWVVRVGAARISEPKRPSSSSGKICLGIGLGGVMAAVGVLVVSGLPGVVFEQSLLRPKQSAAMATYERMQSHFPEWDQETLRWIVEGRDDAQVRARAKAVRQQLDEVKAAHPGLIEGAEMPLDWWPSAAHAEANRRHLEALASRRDELLKAAGDAGFSERGVSFDRLILDAIPQVLARSPEVRPAGLAAREMLRLVSFAESGRRGLIGSVSVTSPGDLSEAELAGLRQIQGDGVSLAGWSLLRPAIRPLVRRDMIYVFLPMLGLMVVMLALVFRDIRDVAVAILAMGVSALGLLAVMRLFGLEWNFLNVAATPLLLGVGLDYLIHILLALRRHGGDIGRVWQGTGKAVVFCGVSTAIGFGSLGLASIEALASLGQVVVAGILIVMGVSVFLVPVLRQMVTK